MAFEMPLDQIKQLQILLRKKANLSWYQPEKQENLALPKLSSVTETIAKLDPSPPYLRCKNCNGRLLRDLQSFICVFCGSNPHKDLPPEPIKFKNTLGYRWILESLNLDGSEMVAPMVEENASYRGRSESKDEIPLSELLDLEIRWPSEAEITRLSNSDWALFPGKSSLNLAGVDLDSFFDRRESDSDVSEQNLAYGRQVGAASDDTFQANENLSLFQNVQASKAVAGSAEELSGGSFSGWEANFKSASSDPVHEEFKSADHSKVESDTVSGDWNNSVGVKKSDDFNPSASTENGWSQGDGWRTSNSEVHSQNGKSELTMDPNHAKTSETASGSSSRNLDWMQDDQWQGCDNKTPVAVATDEADVSFDAWNDFTGSASTRDPSSIISSSEITGQTGKSDFSADLNDRKTEEDASSSSNRDFEWMKDDEWQYKSSNTTDNISTNEAADSFDAWNDFTGSANMQYSSSSVSQSEITGQTGKFELTKDPNDTKTAEIATGSSNNFDWMQDDTWPGSNDRATDIVTTNEVTDSFDAWNDFTGSAISQNPSSSVSNSEVTGQTGKSEITAGLNDTKTAEGADASSVKSFDWMQDDQWQVSNNNTTDNVTTNAIADSFDVWDGFTSLATTQDPSSNVWNQTVNQTSAEKSSEMNFFGSSNNSHDMDFSGFSQHDLFSGQFNNPVSSPAATNDQLAAASSNRVDDVDTRGNSRDVTTAEVGSKDDVEMLMSQMHDLSFMLQSNLSIPPK
ncbi:putative dentin sialophosphoprotein [Sesbania bispinosa]|nr:putative dentin sialophosphoprotein [Sesbania bispinosa]